LIRQKNSSRHERSGGKDNVGNLEFADAEERYLFSLDGGHLDEIILDDNDYDVSQQNDSLQLMVPVIDSATASAAAMESVALRNKISKQKIAIFRHTAANFQQDRMSMGAQNLNFAPNFTNGHKFCILEENFQTR